LLAGLRCARLGVLLAGLRCARLGVLLAGLRCAPLGVLLAGRRRAAFAPRPRPGRFGAVRERLDPVESRGSLVARPRLSPLGAACPPRPFFSVAPRGGDSGVTSGRAVSGGNAGVESATSGQRTTVTSAARRAQARATLAHRTRRKTSRRMLFVGMRAGGFAPRCYREVRNGERTAHLRPHAASRPGC
jgi:hypothetical protein